MPPRLRTWPEADHADHADHAGVDGRAGSCGFGFDSVAKVRRAALLGCRVDSSGAGRGDLDPDTEAVNGAVVALIHQDRCAGQLVLQCGIAGVRPGWAEGAWPRWEPLETRQRPNGERVPVYDYSDDWQGGKRAWYCPLRLVDGPESIRYHRRVYAAWHGGLVWLVGESWGRIGEAFPVTRWVARRPRRRRGGRGITRDSR